MSYKDSIIEYYNKTHFGYKSVWGLYKNLSMHHGFYDDDHRNHNEAVINLNRVLSKKANITKEDTVLDVGCGFGGSSIWIAKNLGAKVIGIDLNKKHIEIARKLAKKNKVDNLTDFRVMDFNDIDFRLGTFSVVWVMEPMVYVKDTKKFLLGIRHVLKRGGRVAIADYFMSRNNYTKSENKLLDKWITGLAGGNMPEINEFFQYMRNVKFRDIEVLDASTNIMPSSRRMYMICSLTFPMGKFLEIFGITSRIQTNSSFGGILQYKALRKDLWTYGIFCAKK